LSSTLLSYLFTSLTSLTQLLTNTSGVFGAAIYGGFKAVPLLVEFFANGRVVDIGRKLVALGTG
jgi:hypothetical protein